MSPSPTTACPILPSTLSKHSPEKSQKPSAPSLLLPPTTTTLSFTPAPASLPSTHPSFSQYKITRDSIFPENTTTFQYSVHKPGRHLLRDLALILPEAKQKGVLQDLLVVPTFQKSAHDLVAVTGETNWERDLLLEYIHAWSYRIVSLLQQSGYWADLADPASGYPVFSHRGTCLYPDVDGAVRLLRYHTVQAGCCRVLVHPQWGTKNYPATIFAAAPFQELQQVLETVSRDPIPMTLTETVEEESGAR